MELKSRNNVELLVKKVEKRWFGLEMLETNPIVTRRRTEGGDFCGYKYYLTHHDTHKNEIKGLKNIKNRDLEDMVYRMELTFDEIVDILDVKNFAGSTKGYTLPPEIYEFKDINSMLASLLAHDVKVIFTSGDNRLRSILTTNKTIKNSKKSSLHKKNMFYSISFKFSELCAEVIHSKLSRKM